jgi:ABC-2 type transport system ATP-binding protein
MTIHLDVPLHLSFTPQSKMAGMLGPCVSNRAILRASVAKPLEFRNLKKQFGSVTALQGVSFGVEEGEVFGYLGPNGAGKTTTLRIALGLSLATSGEAFIFGKPVSDARSRTEIGFLPGDLRLYTDMTARASLEFFARFRPHVKPILREPLIDAFGLDRVTLNRRIKFLSHGTKQKIGLIVAMQHDPALLLLDEPSNGLDPLMQRVLCEAIRGFAARGRSVLLSSHILAEVEAVCQRVAILRDGEIVALETIGKLRENVLRKMIVTFRGVPPQLSDAPGIVVEQRNGQRTELWIRGDLNALLRRIAEAEVDELIFPEPQLDDIFLSYYRNV